MHRMWINQPSTLQPHHDLHATNVLVAREASAPGMRRVYFLRGAVISMVLPAVVLSPGWTTELSNKFMLVYQNGIANVFRVDKFSRQHEGRNAVRILQTDFMSAQVYCHGVIAGGGEVRVAGLAAAGDISNRTWDSNRDTLPFHEEFGDFMLTWIAPHE